MKQLPLSIPIRDHSDFDNFYVAAANQELVNIVRSFSRRDQSGSLFIHGEAQSGRTHLLEAASLHAGRSDLSTVYLPLAELSRNADPDMLEGLESIAVLCLDDVDSIRDRPEWEEALFHLFNRGRSVGQVQIYAAATAPRNIAFRLPDLRSRLGSALVYRLATLNDEEKMHCLQLRAKNLGLALGDDVASYIIRRASRSMSALVQVVDVLDQETLSARRKLTVAFVREVMGW